MKKFNFLVLTALTFSLTSCQPDPNPEADISVSQVSNSTTLEAKINSVNTAYEDLKYEVYDLNDELVTTIEEVNQTNSIELPRHGQFTVKLLSKDGKDLYDEERVTLSVAEINLAYIRATAPVSLFTYLALTEYQGVYSYIDLARGNSYKWDYLPENFKLIPGIRDTYQKDEFGLFQEELPVVREFLKDIVTELPNIKVNLFICDAEPTELVLDMYKLMDEENFTIKFLTDGTLTNNALNDNLLNMDQYASYKENIEKVLADKDSYDKFGASTIENNFVLASMKENVDFYVYDKKTIADNCTDTQLKNLYNIFITELSYLDMYETFDADEKLKREFEYLFGTRWEEDGKENSIAEVFSASEKPNLVILGTSPRGEDVYPYSFETMMEYVVDKYGANYDIFYKGHPAYPSDSSRVKYFEENSIYELPSSTPAEILLTFYPDVYTGGYLSTTYLSAKENQILMVFSTEEDLKNNSAYTGSLDLFENTEFIIDVLNNNN